MGHVSLNLVCVCTNYDKGLLTIESAKEILEIHFEKINPILIVDNSGEFNKYENNITVLGLSGINGSYKARNASISFLEKNFEDTLFIDDDVRVQEFRNYYFKNNQIRGPLVKFFENPADDFENWYFENAFNQKRFKKSFSFLPTIFLFIPTSVFLEMKGFNDQLLSGGDMDFCFRAKNYLNCEIKLNEDIVVQTHLRNKSQILNKLSRQHFGHLYLAKLKLAGQNEIIIFLRILKAFVFLIFSLIGINKHPKEIYLLKIKDLSSIFFLTKELVMKRLFQNNITELEKR